MDADRIYITKAADALDRRVGTVRKWDREGRLPKELKPKRDERNRRYWTSDQVEKIRRWMVTEDLRPGKGLPHNRSRPSEERVQQHLEKLRQPKKRNR